MQWLVDAINNSKTDKIFNFKLSQSKRMHGTVCMPTGTGKSGVMIEDIISKIKDAFFIKEESHACTSFKNNTRFIINISCPTLRLAEQFISDLFEVIDGVIPASYKKQIGLVLNSSDRPVNYHSYNMDIYSGVLSNSIELSLKEKTVIIIASCHRSLQKFICTYKKIENKFFTYNINLHNYIDEAHMLSLKGIFEYKDIPRIDLETLCTMSMSLYLFTATPDYRMLKIADPDYTEKEPYIYHMFAADAIKNNLILPPRIRCVRTKSLANIPLFELILSETKCFGGNRKILITLKNTEDLKNVREVLEKKGYKVFSACAADGFTGEKNLTDAVKFAKAVDNWNDDCFVLQIKQLTQGTDIRTLTDCIVPVSNDINPRTYRHILQTMGRVMRAAPGERGMNYNQRTKKAGNIFFVVLPSASICKEESLQRFALRYYGIECTNYNGTFTMPAEMTNEIEDTKYKIKQYIEKNIAMIRFINSSCNVSIKKAAADIVKTVDAESYNISINNIPEYHLLDNRGLNKYAEEIINILLKQ